MLTRSWKDLLWPRQLPVSSLGCPTPFFSNVLPLQQLPRTTFSSFSQQSECSLCFFCSHEYLCSSKVVLLPFIPESMNHLNFVYFCTYLYKANKDGVVPVLLGFRPTPEYVKFNILWIARKAGVLFNKRRHRVSSCPCLLSPGPISLHINCASIFSARKAWVGLWEKITVLSLLFFSLLLGKHFGSDDGISLLCLMPLYHSIISAETWRVELPLLQLWGRFSWVHKLSRTKELETAS